MTGDEAKKVFTLLNALRAELAPHRRALEWREHGSWKDLCATLLSGKPDDLGRIEDAVCHSAWDHVLSKAILGCTENAPHGMMKTVLRSVIVAIDSITPDRFAEGLACIYREAADDAKDRVYDIAKLAYLGYDPIMNDMVESVVEARWLRRKGVSVHDWIPDDAVIPFGHIAITAGEFPDVHLVLQGDFGSRDGRITYWLGAD